jgi:hypothetical protein
MATLILIGTLGNPRSAVLSSAEYSPLQISLSRIHSTVVGSEWMTQKPKVVNDAEAYESQRERDKAKRV